MAKVRRATAADVDALIPLLQDFHAEAPNYRDEPLDVEKLRRWLAQRMQGSTLLSDDAVVFVAESGGAIRGLLVGFMVDRFFNDLRIAAELMLYVTPASRGGRAFPMLVRAFKDWGRAQGAHKAIVGVSTGIHTDRTVHAYQRLGGKLDGHNLAMDL